MSGALEFRLKDPSKLDRTEYLRVLTAAPTTYFNLSEATNLQIHRDVDTPLELLHLAQIDGSPHKNALRLPSDPAREPIKSDLSVKYMHPEVKNAMGDFLKRLCDVCPGAFEICYWQGFDGREDGDVIVYDGEDGYFHYPYNPSDDY